MKVLLRSLLALLLGLCAGLPLFGEGGGGGEGGVWILPRSGPINGGPRPRGDARLVYHSSDLSRDLVMRLPDGMDTPICTLFDPVSGAIIGLPTDGNQLRISSAILIGLAREQVRSATILVVDRNNQGLVMQLVFSADFTAVDLYVF
ncbi:MAG TPA: hypothetical protein VK348_11100 [Planctomycetota bacterium]|nr:hypothetical protein [Planctomycetota bacterium]